MAQAAEIDLAESSGVALNTSCELMAKRVEGCESLGFTSDDYRNDIRTKRMIQMRRGDTGGVLEYLQGKQLEDPTFFYAIQLDEDEFITNIFWADAKMMNAYSYFGDVVAFILRIGKIKNVVLFLCFLG